jgi:hypothetical protein
MFVDDVEPRSSQLEEEQCRAGCVNAKFGVDRRRCYCIQIRESLTQRSVFVVLLSLSPALHHPLAGFA